MLNRRYHSNLRLSLGLWKSTLPVRRWNCFMDAAGHSSEDSLVTTVCFFWEEAGIE